MAAHTKIIDLFGLPACGKTTLSTYIFEKYGGYHKITTMSRLVKEAKLDGSHLRKSISLRYFFAGLRLRLLAPFDKIHKEIPVLNWPSHARYYCYAKKYSDYDVVLVDHGDIQDFVSLERGVDLHINKRFSDSCARYIDQSLATNYVYCNIEPEVALERMQNRGRKTGRIDVIGDEEEQLQALKSEKKRFDYFAEMLKAKRRNMVELEMDKPIEVIVQELLEKLKDY